MNLTDIVMLLARARTGGHRRTALVHASQSLRFDEDQRRELQALIGESDTAVSGRMLMPLRPTVDPTHESSGLRRLLPGQRAILEDDVRDQVTEWQLGWEHEDGLRLNGSAPPGPVLLYGPTGSGKTTTAASLAGEMKGRTCVVMDCHRFTNSHLGETGKALAAAFDACAKANALLVIEELDAFAESRGAVTSGAAMENNRITVALMRLFESAAFPIMATTNRPDVLDAALLRRFEFKLELKAPDEVRRRVILRAELGREPAPELLALELNDSIPQARRERRRAVLEQLLAT